MKKILFIILTTILSFCSFADTNDKKVENNYTVIVLPSGEKLKALEVVLTEDKVIFTNEKDAIKMAEILKTKGLKEFFKEYDELVKENKAGHIKKNTTIYIVSLTETYYKFYVQEYDKELYILR